MKKGIKSAIGRVQKGIGSVSKGFGGAKMGRAQKLFVPSVSRPGRHKKRRF